MNIDAETKAIRGDADSEEVESDGGGKRRPSISESDIPYKDLESYDMSEDVYAFIVAAPLLSLPFAFAIAIIFTKYIVFGCLMYGIYGKGWTEALNFEGMTISDLIVKLMLVPVALAMQSDLMAVFGGIANVKYDKEVLAISKHATKFKFGLAYFLQLVDGLSSLIVNFCVMMQTDGVLNVLLNFAALHFLQDIDDVFYGLVEKGFFGDTMEDLAITCKQISWPRRDPHSGCSKLKTELDSILYFFILAILYACYFYILSLFIDVRLDGEQDADNVFDST